MNPDFAAALVERFGSPLYVYDLNAVASRAQRLKAALPADACIYYSFKANPLPSLARELRAQGCFAETTSEGELTNAKEAGFLAEEMLFGGPGKSVHEITSALAAGVRWFSCESFTDMARISAAATLQGLTINALLRVNPPDAPDARMAMTGVASQFGMDEELLHDNAGLLRAGWSGIVIRGVHVYFGTQVATREALVDNTRRAMESAERLEKALGMRMEVVNAGGGFPWPYAAEGPAPDFSGMREDIQGLRQNSILAASPRLWFESGRHLVAGSGTLLTTVLDVKRSRSKHFVVVDTGIHHLGGMSGLGRIPRATITIVNLSAKIAPQDSPQITADIVGPLCSPLDSLGRGMTMPEVATGNLLAIPNVGAYGLTASLIGFLSHPAPVEVAVRGTEIVESWQMRTGHRPVFH